MTLKERLYEVLENPGPTDAVAHRWNVVLAAAIVLNLIAVMLETVEAISVQYRAVLRWVEILSVALFGVEYIARVWVATCNPAYSRPIAGRLRYAMTPRALVDLAAIIPSLVATRFDLRFVRVLRLARMVRALKLARYSRAYGVVARVLQKRRAELLVALGLITTLLIVASSLMYFVERDAQPEVFSSIPASMWWAVTTLTTVGYGDIYPVTTLGRALAGIVALLGIGAFALPTSLLGAGFLAELGSRETGKVCPTCGHKS